MSNAASVETLFFAALEKDPGERAAYLDSACGDAELRRQVEKLLKAHSRVGAFLDRPVGEQLAAGRDESAITRELDASANGRPSAPADRQARPPGATPGRRSSRRGQRPRFLAAFLSARFPGSDRTLRGPRGPRSRRLRRVAAARGRDQRAGPELATTSQPRKRFLREARSSAKVRHENVVQVYAVEEQPLPHLVMEFIPGETLQQRLDRTGPL